MSLGTKTVLWLAISAFAAAAAATAVSHLEPMPATDGPGTAVVERPQYGPILSGDPAVVVEIKALYDAERSALTALDAVMDALRDELASIDDADLRLEKQREGAALRMQMEKVHVQYGLDIARLNGDQRAVAEFERALEFHEHPERFRPEPVHVERN